MIDRNYRVLFPRLVNESRYCLEKIAYRVKKTATLSLGPLGLFAGIRFITREKPRILMYHRFSESGAPGKVSADSFRSQIRYLKKHFNLVSMRDIGTQLESGGILPRQAVITIDDGYADFFEVALPILIEENAPATFFITTQFIDGKIWLWPDKLEYILVNSGIPHSQVQSHWKEWVDLLLDHNPSGRESRLAVLAKEYSVRVPDFPPKDYAPCTWQQLRELIVNGIEVGAHTQCHPRLTNLDDEGLAAETLDCKNVIEHELDYQVVSFCYPNGEPEDHDNRVEAAVKSAGYMTAVTAYHDGIRGGQFSLRRLSAGDSHYAFLKAVAGVPLIGHKG